VIAACGVGQDPVHRRARNATSAIEHLGLPTDRAVIMGSQVAL
jgi:hypothetical protein